VTIGEQAVKWYEANEAPEAFAAVLLRCFLFGVVVKRPDLVILAEEVLTDGKQVVAVGAGCRKNCWWLHYVSAPAGTTTTYNFQSEAPYAHDYLGFKRRGKIKIYDWESLVERDIYGWIAFKGKGKERFLCCR
jgi:hypothetical protein